MGKGEETRKRIVTSTARLLNAQGYLSTPVSEIMRVAGLQKGGIYRHFESRAALTREAFEYAFASMRNRLLGAIQGKVTATDRLLALLEVARGALGDDAFCGGCPVMNLAIETDDADPKLRNLARDAMARLVGLLERIIGEGIERGEFTAGDARARAVIMVASMEGAIMLSNLYKDQSYMDAVIDGLERNVRAGLR
jgi:TetR/AcrR family transcriptional regulator, transcriptional repressor for nem operon